MDSNLGLFWISTEQSALLLWMTLYIVPVKHIVHAPPPEILPGCECRVKSRENRLYKAVVPNMGENLVRLTFCWLLTFSSYLCFRSCSFLGQSRGWLESTTGERLRQKSLIRAIDEACRGFNHYKSIDLYNSSCCVIYMYFEAVVDVRWTKWCLSEGTQTDSFQFYTGILLCYTATRVKKVFM